MKECAKCRKLKGEKEFINDKGKIVKTCKRCREYNKERYERNKEQRKKNRVKNIMLEIKSREKNRVKNIMLEIESREKNIIKNTASEIKNIIKITRKTI